MPVVPEGKGRHGRLDVVVWLPGGPDIVVEIAFARDAGAYPLWVRFGKGSIGKIDGVMVLDIRDAVRGVREAGSCADGPRLRAEVTPS
ncbi:hypothetical protein [Streptomyces radicis]|uniref:Uncharacterized protein n=1 Tax=Streptomyces radicis TaxID=1750517 RepID=A0A3A9W2D4_9ACTN|nr:hypothetical protein [Streptomyces radicis]RKN06999.1 hypothetical protein D7319_20080 [Streptomyces radicis]RKN15861.1 hypothetical protein D7318_26715 [Streptomyces radicis]